MPPFCGAACCSCCCAGGGVGPRGAAWAGWGWGCSWAVLGACAVSAAVGAGAAAGAGCGGEAAAAGPPLSPPRNMAMIAELGAGRGSSITASGSIWGFEKGKRLAERGEKRLLLLRCCVASG